MRRLLNILAVVIGLASGLVGVAGAVIAVAGLIALWDTTRGFPADLSAFYPLGIGAGVSFLGCLFASRAWLHLRHPDAGTVRDMIGTAMFLIVFGGVYPLGVRLHAPDWLLLVVFVGLYVFHRYLVSHLSPESGPGVKGKA